MPGEDGTKRSTQDVLDEETTETDKIREIEWTGFSAGFECADNIPAAEIQPTICEAWVVPQAPLEGVK